MLRWWSSACWQAVQGNQDVADYDMILGVGAIIEAVAQHFWTLPKCVGRQAQGVGAPAQDGHLRETSY